MSHMQPQYYNNTSNEDRGLHSLDRLELIQLRLVTPPITSSKSNRRSTWQNKSVGASWQDSIYKPNPFSSSPSSPTCSPRSVSVSSDEEQQHRPVEETRTTKQIEVAPGEFLPLIGANETRDAVREGRMVHTTCLACGLALVCANQADCVLCPSCRVVSPITENDSSRSPAGKKRHYTFGGVGMGLSENEYLELQQHEEEEALNTALGASLSSF